MSQNKTLRFTNANIKKISIPESGRVTYHDSKIHGLQLRVSSTGIKSFCVRSDLGGKTKRVTLGRFPKLSPEKAENLAIAHLSKIAHGIDHYAEQRANKARAVTLRQCLESYISTRSNLKPTTAANYTQCLNQYLDDWLDKPLQSISRDKVEQRHKAIGKVSQTRANTTMRILRAVFEYAHGKYEDENGDPIILHNPVKRLSQAKAWYKETRRNTYIKPADIKPWFESVTTAPDWIVSAIPETIRDYLLLILFTGLRRNEAAGLRWEWVDFKHKILSIPETETKNGHPHTLPLSNYLQNLLQARSNNDSAFIFPGAMTNKRKAEPKDKHLVEPKKPIAKIRDHCGVYFTLHDLRRTFITTAESLGIRDYTLKRLLNHRSAADVTDGYIVTDVERLREPMQQITDRLLMLAEQPDNVLTFPATAKEKS